MRSFFIIWLGQAFSRLGSEIVQFALIWYLTETTGSATVLATASLVGLLPQIAIGPLVGTLVDRWDRRKILIFADSMIAMVTTLLAFLFAIGMVQVWHIYILIIPEEKYLAAKFGGEYKEYTESVHRWLGRK